MTKNKESGLSRILRYAGNYKRLTILGCVLSAAAGSGAVCMRLAGGADAACKLARFFRSCRDWALGLVGGVVCCRKHRCLFCSVDVYAHRGFSNGADDASTNDGACAGVAAGIFHGQSIWAAAEIDR